MTAQRVVEKLLEDNGVIVMAVLTPESSEKLLRTFPPIHPNVKAHHMTVAYKPNQMFFDRYKRMEGQTLKMRVLGHAADERGQAVVVMGPSDNAHPHVTISVADGTEAVYSNELLHKGWESGPRMEIEGKLVIEPL